MSEIKKMWLNLSEASIMAGESKSTLLRRIKKGFLKGKQRSLKGRWLIHINDLSRYCDSNYNEKYKTHIRSEK